MPDQDWSKVSTYLKEEMKEIMRDSSLMSRTHGLRVTYDQAKILISRYFNKKYPGQTSNWDEIKFSVDNDGEALMVVPHQGLDEIVDWGEAFGFRYDGIVGVGEPGIFALLVKILEIENKYPSFTIYIDSEIIHFWWVGEGNPKEEE